MDIMAAYFFTQNSPSSNEKVNTGKFKKRTCCIY